MGSPEFFVGPRDYPVEYSHDELYGNYEGVRTRLETGSRDFIQYYHRQMNAIWKFARDWHETEDFDYGSRDARNRENPGVPHECIRASTAAPGGMEPCGRVSEFHHLELGGGFGS